MKRIIIVCIFILAGIVGAFSFSASSKNPVTNNPLQATPSQIIHSPTPQVPVAKPQRIIIPKLAIDAAIEPVTVDSQGRMDVPTNFNDTAWYSPGAKPGEQGSAVIDGHVDTPTGAPAVFAKINTLKSGDIIQISTDKKIYTFTVIKTASYPLESIPLGTIFDLTTSEKRLNLITCSGTWDANRKIYSNREVVYAKITE
jgi:LPXTG-site transpeptidase (sortase) family protein